jgi:hypothetical protein
MQSLTVTDKKIARLAARLGVPAKFDIGEGEWCWRTSDGKTYYNIFDMINAALDVVERATEGC